MTRIIRIDSCGECPWLYSSGEGTLRCEEGDFDVFAPSETIQDGCPLEEASDGEANK